MANPSRPSHAALSKPPAPRRRLRLVLLGQLPLLALIATVWIRTSPVDPDAYQPEPGADLEGALAPNEDLRAAERLADGLVVGPEDVAVDDRGHIYGGTEDGKIVRLDPDGTNLKVVAETGGRPLGLHFDGDGRLIVADAVTGLLRVQVTGEQAGNVDVLSTEVGGVPFAFTDDLDIASDGRIYFSDASWRHDHHHYLYDLLEARPYGRLLRYDPATGETEVLLDGLYFANGIALSTAEDFVLVNETYRYRIRRYWLTGPKAGSDDIFIDRLPGFPDGVSANREGTFWVALFTVRNPIMDALHPWPFLKKAVGSLPPALWPKPAPYGLVIGLDEDGRVVRSLHDVGVENVMHITSAEEVDGTLYLGNLKLGWIGRVRL